MTKRVLYLLLAFLSFAVGLSVQLIGNYVIDLKYNQIYVENEELINQASNIEVDGYENTEPPTPIYGSEEEEDIIEEASNVLEPVDQMGENIKLLYVAMYLLAFVLTVLVINDHAANKTNKETVKRS